MAIIYMTVSIYLDFKTTESKEDVFVNGIF